MSTDPQSPSAGVAIFRRRPVFFVLVAAIFVYVAIDLVKCCMRVRTALELATLAGQTLHSIPAGFTPAQTGLRIGFKCSGIKRLPQLIITPPVYSAPNPGHQRAIRRSLLRGAIARRSCAMPAFPFPTLLVMAQEG